jgi:hypothetical protein
MATETRGTAMTCPIGHFDLSTEHRRILFNALAWNPNDGTFNRDFYVLTNPNDPNRVTVRDLVDKKIFKEIDAGMVKFYRVTKYGKSVARRLVDLGYKRRYHPDHLSPQRKVKSFGER